MRPNIQWHVHVVALIRCSHTCHSQYGVATISRLLKNIGLIAEYRSLLWGSFAKETYIYTHSLIEHNESNDMNVPLDIGTHQFFGVCCSVMLQ